MSIRLDSLVDEEASDSKDPILEKKTMAALKN